MPELTRRWYRKPRTWLALAVAGAIVGLACAALLCDIAPYAGSVGATGCEASPTLRRFRVAVAWLSGLCGVLTAALLFSGPRPSRLATDANRLRARLRAAAAATPRADWVALTLIVGIGVALRAAYLTQPMRSDEAFTYTEYASLPWFVAVGYYTYPNNHIFHTLLVQAATALAGPAPWAIRMPAFVASVLVIPAAYAAARARSSPRAALWTAGLAAGSGWLTLYATNARGYSLVLLLFLAQLAAARTLVADPERNRAAWAVFGLSGALALFTTPGALYSVGAVTLWVAVAFGAAPRARSGAALRELLTVSAGMAVLAGYLYVPVLLDTGIRSLVANEYVVPSDLHQLEVAARPFVQKLASEWMLGLPLAAALTLAVIAVVGAAREGIFWRDAPPFWIVALGWTAALLAGTRHLPYTRVWMYLLIVTMLSAGSGLALVAGGSNRAQSKLAGRGRALLPVLLALALATSVYRSRAVYLSDDTGTLREAPAIAAWLGDRLAPADAVVTDAASGNTLRYYFARRGVPMSHLTQPAAVADRVYAVVNWRLAQTMDSVFATHHLAKAAYLPPTTRHAFRDATVYELRARGSP
ncbi:MAG: hypothetical protein WKG32_07835 [Gemmatimonadaceae bacterium]